MKSRKILNKKPFITASVFSLLGIAAIFSGFTLASETLKSDFYALAVFGILFLLVGIIVFSMYGALEAKFQRMVFGSGVLLRYTVGTADYLKVSGQTAEDIRATNKGLLFIMLFFCALIAVIGPFIVEDGYIFSITGICLGVFLSVMYAVITSYRINKITKGSKEVILSKDAVYVCGEFHCWNFKGNKLNEIKFYEAGEYKGVDVALIKITYQALTMPGPSVYTALLPVPSGMEDAARTAIGGI